MRTRFGPDDEDAFVATRDALVDAYAGVLGETHDVPDTFVASIMLDYKWGYRDGDIGTWQRVDIEDLLLGHFPLNPGKLEAPRCWQDIATLLRAGHRLADVIGYATTIFDRRLDFPTQVFLRSLVWFGDGTAGDVSPEVRSELEMAVHDLDLADIPLVQPYRPTITPGVGRPKA